MRTAIACCVALLAASTATAQYRGYAIFSCRPYVLHRHVYYPPAHYSPGYPIHYGWRYPHASLGYAETFYYDPCYGYNYQYPSYRSNVYSVYGESTGYAPPRRYEDLVRDDATPPPDGWDLLSKGDARGAIKAFTDLARVEPNDAAPKIGYALAAAELGDDSTAIWAMRRAFRHDAMGAHYIPLNDELRALVNDHREYFEYEAQYGPWDTYFMIAALRFIAHEHDEARAAALVAREQADRSSELRQLERQLDRIEREEAAERKAVQEAIEAEAKGASDAAAVAQPGKEGTR